ncbi:hypothetical protein HHI36_000080 [Cryptolaemus montrouzieri]|uniref:Uncharacterized protein n=1 Tax=Cryptolaemus montrouzieri TaxID=559131 RepID=A0ABD2P3M2_9CUCU
MYCKSDWIEITQTQEESSSKFPSKTKHYSFPRNEYVYTTSPSTIKKFIETPYYPSSTTPSTSSRYIETTISSPTKVPPISEQQATFEYISSKNPATEHTITKTYPTKMEDRMDSFDTTRVESEMFVQTTENSGTIVDEKTNYWSTGNSGKAAIVRMKDENIKAEKLTSEGFIPFLKKVQDDIISKTHKNFKGKINMLKNLRDDLLLNIDERINHLWGRKSSEARDHKEDDYDMHFPSNEGALMTIGFLTFAVFLIKLVLKLVQALKDKQNMMMVVPTMMTNANMMTGKRKRDTTYAEQNNILQLIEEYSFT